MDTVPTSRKLYGVAPALGALLAPKAIESFKLPTSSRVGIGLAAGIAGAFGPLAISAALQGRGVSQVTADFAGYGTVGLAGIGTLLAAHRFGGPGRLTGILELAGFSAGLSAAAIAGGIAALEGWNHLVGAFD